MNKKILCLAGIAVLFALAFESCTQTVAPDGEAYRSVRFIVPDIPYFPDEGLGESTKAALKTDPISFIWETNDTVGIFPNQGGQVPFSMESGAGTNTAYFDGGGWALKETSTYFSYYPLQGHFYLDYRDIPVSFEGQHQSSISNPYSNARFFLASKGLSDGKGGLIFNYNILNVILNVNCTLPAGVYTELTLETENDCFALDGHYNLSATTPEIAGSRKSSKISMTLDNLSLPTESVLPLYIMLAPVNLNGVTITVTVNESTGRKYVCEKVPSKAYLAGSRYGLTCNAMTEYAADYPEGVDSSETDLGDDDEVIIIK